MGSIVKNSSVLFDKVNIPFPIQLFDTGLTTLVHPSSPH